MIERYSTPQMRELWGLNHKFEVWREIEIAGVAYWKNQGRVPEEDFQQIRNKASFTVERINQIENEVHHDVIAFLTNMAENIGPASRHVHFGFTSSDVGDTALAYIIREVALVIKDRMEDLLESLYARAQETRENIVVGRTHGIHAEPTTLGLKLLGYYTETQRNYERLLLAIEDISYGKISGAVGTYSQLPPELEKFVLDQLGLKVEPVSTQVIPRDRHAFFLSVLSLIAQGLSRLAQEIRLLQKTESREVEEPFQKGQKGSSAMPHKRNPILSERICGLARVIQGYSQTASMNIGLWHERDISHSSAERIILPDATSLLEYMLIKMKFIVDKMHIYPLNSEKVINETGGLLYSSRALLVITEEMKIPREDAYAIVQGHAMDIWEKPSGGNLRSRLEGDPRLQQISQEKWDYVFDPRSFLLEITRIFERVEPFVKRTSNASA